MLESYLTSLLASVTYGFLERNTSLHISSPLESAIQKTDLAYTSICGVANSLTNWCDSPVFAKLLHNISNGNEVITDEVIVNSYIETTEFYTGEDSPYNYAREILEFFFNVFKDELLKSEDGSLLHDRRMKTQTETILMNVSNLQHGINQLNEKIDSSQIFCGTSSDKDIINSTEEKYSIRIDDARALIQKGQPRTAMMMLLRIRQDLASETVSNQLLFRIAANIGSCALELDDIELARREFDIALASSPDHPFALSNIARIAMLDNNISKADEYIDKAMKKARDNWDKFLFPAMVYIEILSKTNRNEELEQFIKQQPAIVSDQGCILTIGIHYLNKYDYATAEYYFGIACDLEPGDFKPYYFLALAIYIPMQKDIESSSVLPWHIEKEKICRIEKAEEFVNKAIGIIDNYENVNRRNEVFILRSAVRAMLPGREEDAITDCQKVLANDSDNYYALRNSGLLLLRLGKYVDAITSFERIANKALVESDTIYLANAYLLAKRYHDVVNIVSPLLDSCQSEDDYLTLIELLIDAYWELNDFEQVDNAINILKERSDINIDAQVILAKQYVRKGSLSEAYKLLYGITLRISEVDEKTRLAIADLYYLSGKYDIATKLYEPIVEINGENRTFQRYVIALYNNGDYKKALSLSESVRGQKNAIPVISEIESRINEFIGDLNKALDLRLALINIEQDNIEHIIRSAYLSYRINDIGLSHSLISKIKFNNIKDNPIALMQTAELRDLLDLGHVLEYAYQARRIAISDPNIHTAYVRLFLKNDNRESVVMQPSKVCIDSVVTIENDNRKRIVTIIGDNKVISESEVNPSESLAQLLMDKNLGDIVHVQEEGPGAQEYSISMIRHKYLAMFQETLKEFGSRFPENYNIQMVEVDTNNPQTILGILDMKYKTSKMVIDYYREKKIPLSSMAQMMGCSLLDVWHGITGMNETVLVSYGNIKERDKALDKIGKSINITIDLVSLQTIFAIGIQYQFVDRFKSIYIAQPIMDELSIALNNAIEKMSGSGSMYKDGDHYAYLENTQEIIDKEVKYLRDMKEFISSKMKVVPVRHMLDMDMARYHDMCRTIGINALSPALVAKEYRCLLYSDDLYLREIAHIEWNVDGVWTQILIDELLNTGIINYNESYEYTCLLAHLNYHFTAISADAIIYLLSKSGYKITDKILSTFKLISGDRSDEEPAISVAVEIIYNAWLKVVLPAYKYLILDYTLKYLLCGRDGNRVILRLESALRKRFILNPLHLQDIVDNIRIWINQHAIGNRMIQTIY